MNFNMAQFIRSFGLSDQLPESDAAMPELVVTGRSNVGKSSLINKLCNRKSLARVSGTPGKTTTINFFSMPGGLLVDLPGYGYAVRSQSEKQRWAQLMDHYFTSGRHISLALQLLDCRHDPSDDDHTMMSFLQHAGVPVCAVLTKADKLSKTQLKARIEAFSDILAPYGVLSITPFTVNGSGAAEVLRAEIEKRMVVEE